MIINGAFILYLAAAVTWAEETGNANDSSAIKPKSLRNSATTEYRLLKKLQTYPLENGKIYCGRKFMYQKYPLSGAFSAAAFDRVAEKMNAVLSTCGPVRTVSVAECYTGIVKRTPDFMAYDYLCMPIEIETHSKEKSMTVHCFAKLNAQGEFEPNQSSANYKKMETERLVRFVVIDLKTRKITFDRRIKGAEGSDRIDSLNSVKEKGTKTRTIKTNVRESNENIDKISIKIENSLKEQFIR